MRRLDAIGLALLAGLAVAMIGGGVALVASGLVKAWELAAVLSFGTVLVASAHPRAAPAAPHNTRVHGAAAPASEHEAHAAARGDTKTAPMHDATFPD